MTTLVYQRVPSARRLARTVIVFGLTVLGAGFAPGVLAEPGVARVGFLGGGSATQAAHLTQAFRDALREFVDAGGLMSYSVSFPEQFRRAATYVDKILKGARPGDLPVEQPTRIVFTVNSKAAQALGVALPQSLLLRADEVIR